VSYTASDLGVLRAHLAANLDAVPIGEPDVEYGYSRPGGGDAFEGLGGGGGFANHLDPPVGLQEAAQPLSNHFVVVEEKHPDRD
jgi:hypothetical protein